MARGDRQVSVYLDPEVYAKAVRAARAEDRSVSKFVAHCVRRAVEGVSPGARGAAAAKTPASSPRPPADLTAPAAPAAPDLPPPFRVCVHCWAAIRTFSSICSDCGGAYPSPTEEEEVVVEESPPDESPPGTWMTEEEVKEWYRNAQAEADAMRTATDSPPDSSSDSPPDSPPDSSTDDLIKENPHELAHDSSSNPPPDPLEQSFHAEVADQVGFAMVDVPMDGPINAAEYDVPNDWVDRTGMTRAENLRRYGEDETLAYWPPIRKPHMDVDAPIDLSSLKLNGSGK